MNFPLHLKNHSKVSLPNSEEMIKSQHQSHISNTRSPGKWNDRSPATRHLDHSYAGSISHYCLQNQQTGSCYCWRPAEWLMEPFILPPWDHHKCCSTIQPSSELQAPPGRQLGDVRHTLTLSCTDQIQPQKSWSLERLNGRESSTSLPESFIGNDYCTSIPLANY